VRHAVAARVFLGVEQGRETGRDRGLVEQRFAREPDVDGTGHEVIREMPAIRRGG
jgi:hypothetical protein